jgi:hypothetical protein
MPEDGKVPSQRLLWLALATWNDDYATAAVHMHAVRRFKLPCASTSGLL